MSPAAAEIALEIGCARWAEFCPEAEHVVRAAAGLALAAGMAAAGMAVAAPIELSIALVDDTALRRLNREWRRIDRATNVLAFPAWTPGPPPPAGAPLLLGDLALAAETVEREAAEQGKTAADHLAHLVVHGVLHLIGYDHVTATEAAVMEGLETSILARLGVADPYRGTM